MPALPVHGVAWRRHAAPARGARAPPRRRERAEAPPHARDVARTEAARIRREAERRRQRAEQSAARRSLRGVDPRDHDTREKIGRAVVAGKDGIAGRSRAVAAARLERAERAAEATFVERRYDGSVWMDVQPSARKVLFALRPACFRLTAARPLAARMLAPARSNFALPSLRDAGRSGAADPPQGATMNTMLREMLGYGDDEIESLREAGIFQSSAASSPIEPAHALDAGSQRLLEELADIRP